jgi:hypothetical protein
MKQYPRIPYGLGNALQFNQSTVNQASSEDFTAGDLLLEDYSSISNLPQVGEFVTASGTKGVSLSGVTATTTSGSATITVSNSSRLRAGGYINISGVSGTYRILVINGTTLTLNAKAAAAVSDAAVSWAVPGSVPVMPLDARAYRSGVGSGGINPDATKDFFIDANGGPIYLQPAAYYATGKQYLIRHASGVSPISIVPHSGTTINGLSKLLLPNINDYVLLEWNGTRNWNVIGGSPAALEGAEISFALPSQAAIASATTITPSKRYFHVTGTAAIRTITVPPGCTSIGTMCQMTLIPDGLWATTTAGNIALASMAVVSKALIMTYDPSTSRWYPSY